MKTFIAEYTDEAAGMVRYGNMTIRATSLSEARRKAKKITEKSGPGFWFTSIKELLVHFNNKGKGDLT